MKVTKREISEYEIEDPVSVSVGDSDDSNSVRSNSVRIEFTADTGDRFVVCVTPSRALDIARDIREFVANRIGRRAAAAAPQISDEGTVRL